MLEERRLDTKIHDYALIVDAKDAKAKEFYEHFGFLSFADNAMSLYLAIKEPG